MLYITFQRKQLRFILEYNAYIVICRGLVALTLYLGGRGRAEGRRRKGCRPAAGPHPELLLRAFLSCVPSFPFSIFYVYFPEIINYVWKEGLKSRTRGDRNRGDSERGCCVLFLFFMGSHARGAAALPWRLHRIIRQRGRVATPLRYK